MYRERISVAAPDERDVGLGWHCGLRLEVRELAACWLRGLVKCTDMHNDATGHPVYALVIREVTREAIRGCLLRYSACPFRSTAVVGGMWRVWLPYTAMQLRGLSTAAYCVWDVGACVVAAQVRRSLPHQGQSLHMPNARA